MPMHTGILLFIFAMLKSVIIIILASAAIPGFSGYILGALLCLKILYHEDKTWSVGF